MATPSIATLQAKYDAAKTNMLALQKTVMDDATYKAAKTALTKAKNALEKAEKGPAPACCYSCKNWFHNRPGNTPFNEKAYLYNKRSYCLYCLPGAMGAPNEEEALLFIANLQQA
jgi:hypothetical protein